ncbi:hypothetical protein BKA18_001089 [Streptomyces auratus]
MIYCGIDWAETHHDIALIDDTGQLLAKRRIMDDAAGYQLLLDLLAEYGDTEDAPIPVAIETSRGLLVAALRQGRRKVFAVNPMAAAHYRHRREAGDWHAQAQRHLFNRMLGQHFPCLKTGELFDEHQAFPSLLAVAA